MKSSKAFLFEGKRYRVVFAHGTVFNKESWHALPEILFIASENEYMLSQAKKIFQSKTIKSIRK